LTIVVTVFGPAAGEDGVVVELPVIEGEAGAGFVNAARCRGNRHILHQILNEKMINRKRFFK